MSHTPAHAEDVPRCVRCNWPIEPAGWPSWRHLRGSPSGRTHPAEADGKAKALVAAQAA